MTILITGASGLLAPYLVRTAGNYGDVVTTSRTQGDVLCDLTDLDQTRLMLKKVRPDWLIHAAAMTNVDACESDSALAQQVNAVAVQNIVSHMEPDTCLAYLSTDQVYPDIPGPHQEGTENPVNVYGQTKLEGERNALRHKNCLVFRANLFGHSMTEGRSSLDDFIVNGLREGKSITIFKDVLFSPLHMSTLVSIIYECMERGLHGIFNTGSRSGMSKAEFAFAVADHLNLDTKTATVGESASQAGRAPRALDLRMAVTKLETALGRAMPTLMQEIKKL